MRLQTDYTYTHKDTQGSQRTQQHKQFRRIEKKNFPILYNVPHTLNFHLDTKSLFPCGFTSRLVHNTPPTWSLKTQKLWPTQGGTLHPHGQQRHYIQAFQIQFTCLRKLLSPVHTKFGQRKYLAAGNCRINEHVFMKKQHLLSNFSER